MPDINVVLMDNPFGVKGSVNKNLDDSYTIIINANLSAEQQKEVYLHELQHIIGEDFSKEDINKIETSAHNMELFSI